MGCDETKGEIHNYIKVIKIAIIILIIIGAYFVNYFHNIKENGDVSIAKQTLYEVTQTDRDQIKFELSQEDNNLNIKNEEYHVFKVVKENGERCDINYIVNKNNSKVYVCDKRGFVIPYEDYINRDSIIANYFEELKNMSYSDIPPSTKEYFETQGGIAFVEKIEEIMEVINLDTIDQWGGMVMYIDLLIK